MATHWYVSMFSMISSWLWFVLLSTRSNSRNVLPLLQANSRCIASSKSNTFRLCSRNSLSAELLPCQSVTT